MSSDKLQLLSPLFLKYQSEYEKNPRSRVFAPLAETYRKLGMTEKAMEILSQGIRFHPTYVMGYLGLAFCYFDIKQYNLAYSTLRPLVESNRDNIRLQKLFADVCLELSQKEEALETYKYLLFINPRDKEVAAQVKTLEAIIDSQYKPNHKPIFIPENDLGGRSTDGPSSTILFDIDKLDSKTRPEQKDFDDWMALDLSQDTAPDNKEDKYDFWNLQKGKPNSLPMIEKASIEEKTEDDDRSYKVKLDLDDDAQEDDESKIYDTSNSQNEKKVETPLVTHTLVDLYCGQGHIEKALEVLEKILILNPTDKKTINKIAEIKALMGQEREVENHADLQMESVVEEPFIFPEAKPQDRALKLFDESTVSEEAGRMHLMSLIDETLGSEPVVSNPEEREPASDRIKAIEEKLTSFLQRIHKRALDYQSRV